MSYMIGYFRVLGDETRWRIARMVAEEALCICELAEVLGMPQSTVSSQVQVMKKVGMLDSEESGKWSYYRLKPEVREWLERVRAGEEEDPQVEKDMEMARERILKRGEGTCRGPERLK